MKIIGRGWQYTVYDMGNGRVLKKLNNKFVAYLMMLHDSFPYIKHPIWKFPQYYKRCKIEAVESMQKVLNSTLDLWMLGNPQIENEWQYEQDKMTPLRICLERATEEEGQKVINVFIEFNKILVAHSLIDRNFLITDNFAMNDKKQIILMDLGELYFDAIQIQNHILKRPWATSDVKHSLPKNLRSYFIDQMDNAFPLVNLKG